MDPSKRRLILLLWILVAVMGAYAVGQHLEVRRLSRAAAEADQRAGFEKRAREAQAQARALEELLANGSKKPEAADTPAAAGTEPVKGGEAHVAVSLVRNWLSLMNDPEVMRLVNIQRRGQILRTYTGLIKHLGLTDAQSEALTQLLIDKNQAAMDVAVSSVQQGLDPLADPAQFSTMVGNSKAGIEDQIKGLLGETGYAQYQAYDRGEQQYQVLSNLAQSLMYSEDPLKADQVAKLEQLMAQQRTGQIDETVLTGAKEFLTPAQLQALKSLQEEQQAATHQKMVSQQVLQDLASPVEAAGATGN